MPSFGENLRSLRKMRGYSQDRFAKEIGSNQITVSSWEVGSRMPSFETIKKIADTFKIPLSSLLPLEDTQIYDDDIRGIIDVIYSRADIRKLFELVQFMSEQEVEALVGVASIIAKDR